MYPIPEVQSLSTAFMTSSSMNPISSNKHGIDVKYKAQKYLFWFCFVCYCTESGRWRTFSEDEIYKEGTVMIIILIDKFFELLLPSTAVN